MGSTMIVRSESPVSGRALQVQPSQDEVRDQLGRILASPLFKNSRHYPALLRSSWKKRLRAAAVI